MDITGYNRPLLMLIIIGIVLIIVQFVRFFVPALALDNPPVTYDVPWDSDATKTLFYQACADCHSNETDYPFYAYIAPPGWLVALDVHWGRAEYNISENYQIDVEHMISAVDEGWMPPSQYTLLHPEAVLSDGEKAVLIEGLKKTFPQIAEAVHD